MKRVRLKRNVNMKRLILSKAYWWRVKNRKGEILKIKAKPTVLPMDRRFLNHMGYKSYPNFIEFFIKKRIISKSGVTSELIKRGIIKKIGE